MRKRERENSRVNKPRQWVNEENGQKRFRQSQKTVTKLVWAWTALREIVDPGPEAARGTGGYLTSGQPPTQGLRDSLLARLERFLDHTSRDSHSNSQSLVTRARLCSDW